MKELSRNVLQDRRKYKKLTYKLRQLNIRYRWEIPEGVSFNYSSLRQSITTTMEMIRFMCDNSKDFGKDK